MALSLPSFEFSTSPFNPTWYLGAYASMHIVFALRESTKVSYKLAISTCGGEKRRERRKVSYRFVASSSTDSKILCVYERCDYINVVIYIVQLLI